MIHKIRRRVSKLRVPAPLYKALNGSKPSYTCNLCGYTGPFRDTIGRYLSKTDSRCPSCDSIERVRIEWAALQEVFAKRDPSTMKVIHFAPEHKISALLRSRVASYETADLSMAGVDHLEDLTRLSFADASYDLVIASHVLEHIQDDLKALAEIKRILKPGGVAILPVPTFKTPTVEYGAPRPEEEGHVRAPGPDYYDRFKPFFRRVDVRVSADYPPSLQLLARPFGTTDQNPAYVPICYA